MTGDYVDAGHVTQCGEAISAQMLEIIEARQPGFGDFSVALPGREPWP